MRVLVFLVVLVVAALICWAIVTISNNRKDRKRQMEHELAALREQAIFDRRALNNVLNTARQYSTTESLLAEVIIADVNQYLEKREMGVIS